MQGEAQGAENPVDRLGRPSVERRAWRCSSLTAWSGLLIMMVCSPSWLTAIHSWLYNINGIFAGNDVVISGAAYFPPSPNGEVGTPVGSARAHILLLRGRIDTKQMYGNVAVSSGIPQRRHRVRSAGAYLIRPREHSPHVSVGHQPLIA